MLTHVTGFKLLFLMVAATAGISLAAPGTAAAQSCFNDDDCPEPACGGQVCNWNKNPFVCNAAGTDPKGMDGWCTTDDDCKCKALGAVCDAPYCTFTKASDAPGAGTGGAAGGTGGAAGGTGGATGSGGASANDSGTMPPKDDGGGCAIAGGATTSVFGSIVALVGLAGLSRRRRQN